MSKNKYIVVQELDPDSIEGLPELYKNHYLKLGYKPYLMGDGSTKWLTDTQRVYKETRAIHKITVKKPPPMKINGMIRKRKNSNRIVRFFRRHWLMILLVIFALIIVFYYTR